MAPKVPSYPTYTPPPRPSVPDSYDSYEAEKNKTFNKPLASRGKGMQLGKKNKTTDIYEKVRGDLGPEAEDSAPLVSAQASTPTTTQAATPSRPSLDHTTSPINIAIAETISAKLSREGSLKSFEVKGDLNLRISDPSLTKLSLSLLANEGPHHAQFRTHPNVDRNLFTSSKTIQLKDPTKRFPSNNSIGVLRWRVTAPADTSDIAPLLFTVWVNKSSSDSTYTITIEYEHNPAVSPSLRDVVVTIPYTTSEPAVSSFDAMYEVTGDSLDWTIGTIDESNGSGSFEFEAQADDEGEFFPMNVRFEMGKPFVDVDVQGVKLLEGEMGEEVGFEKSVKSSGEAYAVE